jgi:hypothetical protein
MMGTEDRDECKSHAGRMDRSDERGQYYIGGRKLRLKQARRGVSRTV